MGLGRREGIEQKGREDGAEEVKIPLDRSLPCLFGLTQKGFGALATHGCHSRKFCKRRGASVSSLSSCKRSTEYSENVSYLHSQCGICGQSSFLQREEALEGEKCY